MVSTGLYPTRTENYVTARTLCQYRELKFHQCRYRHLYHSWHEPDVHNPDIQILKWHNQCNFRIREPQAVAIKPRTCGSLILLRRQNEAVQLSFILSFLCYVKHSQSIDNHLKSWYCHNKASASKRKGGLSCRPMEVVLFLYKFSFNNKNNSILIYFIVIQ